jgi:long-chain fatty acid transport protein
MRKHQLLTAICSVSLLAVLGSTAYASGFESFETNASGLGNAYAGGAAIADDASTEFDNPAGIVRLANPEVDLGGVIIMAHGKFHEDQTSNPLAWGSNTANPLGTNYMPSLHFVAPLFDRLYFAFGMTVPFGYFTDYEQTSIASDWATESRIMTINLNPSFAFKINDKFSIGAGFDAQYLQAKLNRYVKVLIDTDEAKADDWGYGWNAGIMYQFNDATRLGLSYRSQVTHRPEGNNSEERLGMPLGIGNGLYTYDISTGITIPEVITFSAYHEFSEKIAAMATLNWTHWCKFQQLDMRFTNGFSPLGKSLPDKDMILPESFHNTYHVALGFNYKIDEHWKLKFGTAYDQSPVDDANRTIQLPDADRIWLATGAEYTFNHYVVVNAGYAHIFIRNGSMNFNDPVVSNIKGHYDHVYANLIGLQVNVKFE